MRAAGHSMPIKRALASACVAEVRMTRITSSMLACASSKPSTVCLRCRALASKNCVRRRMTSARWRMNSSSSSLIDSVRGLPSTSARKISENRVLQRRELIELVEHDLRIGVALDFEDQTHGLLQIALVADGRDADDAILVHQLGDPLFDAVARLLERDLGDDDARSAPCCALRCAPAHGPRPCHGRCDSPAECRPGRK